jgi:hypothetical protein
MTLLQIRNKYLWFGAITIVVGFVCGFLLRGTAIRNAVLSLVNGVSVEISNETDITPVDNEIPWLGLRVKVSVSGKEKKAFRDYTLEVKPPGLEERYTLLSSKDGESYIFPIWPFSDPGEHRFFITTNDNPGSPPLEDSVIFPGIIEKQNLYRALDSDRTSSRV